MNDTVLFFSTEEQAVANIWAKEKKTVVAKEDPPIKSQKKLMAIKGINDICNFVFQISKRNSNKFRFYRFILESSVSSISPDSSDSEDDEPLVKPKPKPPTVRNCLVL